MIDHYHTVVDAVAAFNGLSTCVCTITAVALKFINIAVMALTRSNV